MASPGYIGNMMPILSGGAGLGTMRLGRALKRAAFEIFATTLIADCARGMGRACRAGGTLFVAWEANMLDRICMMVSYPYRPQQPASAPARRCKALCDTTDKLHVGP